jgi:hypothetical protein
MGAAHRALGLFATLTLEPLVERVIETLCLRPARRAACSGCGDAPPARSSWRPRGLVQVVGAELLDPGRRRTWAVPGLAGGCATPARARPGGWRTLDGDGFATATRGGREGGAGRALANAPRARAGRRSFRDRSPRPTAGVLSRTWSATIRPVASRSFALLTLGSGIAWGAHAHERSRVRALARGVALQVGRAAFDRPVAAEGDGRHRAAARPTRSARRCSSAGSARC